MIRPRGDGKTLVTARLGKLTATVPLDVRGVTNPQPPRFASDVVPVLTKGGCNQGACHGAASGKGGFKLSLMGYDPDADFDAIVRGSRGRRIVRNAPEASLILRKPTLGVAHKGGKRMEVGSTLYRILGDWIANGIRPPAADEPRTVRLEVTPPTRTIRQGQTQRFRVTAALSDGTRRDVTAETVFTASDETVAKVSPDGEAKSAGPGEGAVLIRYRDRVATARLITPFGTPQAPAGFVSSARGVKRTEDEIDRLVSAKLAALGLPSSSRCSDGDFLRRATLDVTGLLPTPDETRRFLGDRDPDKRNKLIDSLLQRPEYVDCWTVKWADILRSSRRFLAEKGVASFNSWIRDSVARNKPWDQFARELLLSRGSAYEEGPANFFRTANTPLEFSEATAQIFLGVRIQCARCHNHPYEKWTQNQYYEMAAFFARVKARKQDGQTEPFISLASSGEVKHPKSQKEVAACALDSAPLPANFRGDRREPLVAWLTSPKNPFFAHAVVNRIWRQYMGRGFVEPVDDLRVTNPPSNEPLYDWLATDLTDHGYDLKYLMRSIMRSQAYQRTAQPVTGNERDARFYSHNSFKRLTAEQLMDAISQVTGVPDKFAGFPMGTRAEQLPDAAVPSYFLDLFGRPARNATCACERVDEPNLGQVLHLMNNSGLNTRIADKKGRAASLIEGKLPNNRLVEELYLASFSRLPNAFELSKGVQSLAKAKNRQQSAEDLLWVLLNSKEFVFNH
jgi:hypothetical protein